MNSIIRSGIALAMLSLSTSALAHHPSGAGNTGSAGPINVIGAGTLAAGQSAAAVFFETIRLEALSDATLKLSAMNGEHAHGHGHGGADKIGAHSLDRISTWWASAAYGVTNDLTVSLRLPYVSRTNVREGLHFHHHHHLGNHVNVVEHLGDASGIGDLTAMAQYRFLNQPASGTEAAVLLGVKAPTGRTGETTNDGERFEAEFQPGSGSWDGLFGAALSQRLGGPLSFHASALYTLVSEGTQQTDLGDRVHYGAALVYRMGGGNAGSGPMYAGAHNHKHKGHAHADHEHAPTPALNVDLVLELNGEWQAKHKVDGEREANSGGHTLYVSPGVRMSYDKLSGFASVGIPVVNDLNGLQAEPDWRLVTGVSVAF